MQELEERDMCEVYFLKEKKNFYISTGLIVYLTIVYYLPDITGSSRDDNCKMDIAFANAMFGWVLMGAASANSALFCAIYLIKKRQTAD